MKVNKKNLFIYMEMKERYKRSAEMFVKVGLQLIKLKMSFAEGYSGSSHLVNALTLL